MPTKTELWEKFEPIARSLSLEIFELEVPNAHSRVMRVYLARGRGDALENVALADEPDAIEPGSEGTVNPEESVAEVDSGVVAEGLTKKGVSLDECARFSKTLSRLEGFDDLFDGNWTLEVSSPGINRRLTRPEHFEGAVGERVKVKFRESEERNAVARGVLSQFDGATLTVEDEEKGASVVVAFGQVNEARVDFLFTSER